MTTMYGIPNCDTIKKAKRWLNDHEIAFEFYDYKKQTPPQEMLEQAISHHGKALVVNKRGTSYRKLSDSDKETLDSAGAIDILKANASVIKRPIIVHNNKTLIGFSEHSYLEFFDLA
jgi:Spx/MgsR family transcriptional regulator